MKKFVSVLLICALMLCTCGCKPKSSRTLIREARNNHGDCEVVSVTEEDDSVEVVLHDELQDFDYVVRSYMVDVNLDGSSFGQAESSSDTFSEELANMVFENIEDELEVICEEMGTSYLAQDETIYLLPVIVAEDEESGIEAGIRVAELVQEYNLDGRMDGWQIVVQDTHRDRFGHVALPDISFVNNVQETINGYLDTARTYDDGAVYLRTEEVPFNETGCDYSLVVSSFEDEYPRSEDELVTLYFFEDSNGEEFWIASFSVQDPDTGYFGKATNFYNR